MNDVRKYFLGLILITLALDCSSGQQPGFDMDAEVAAAKSAIKELAGALQTELKSAMQAGGPVAAIGVCSTRALPITANVGAGQGMDLARVSLKNRNPANAPNDWQTAVLEKFEHSKMAGRDVAGLTWSDAVSVDGENEFRFMKAIPTGGICLTCHGSELAPEVRGALSEIYPEDRATGFSEGDIRGAFVVTRRLSN